MKALMIATLIVAYSPVFAQNSAQPASAKDTANTCNAHRTGMKKSIERCLNFRMEKERCNCFDKWRKHFEKEPMKSCEDYWEKYRRQQERERFGKVYCN